MRRCDLLLAVLLLLGSVSLAAPVHDAAAKGDTDRVRALVRADRAILASREHGWTPLHVTAARGRADTVKLLVQAGADVNAAGKLGAAPLHLAAYAGSAAVVGALLNCKANVNARDAQGVTPLHLAAMHGNADAGTLLLDRGAQIEAKDRQGFTPFHCAVARDSGSMIVLLAERKANVNAVSDAGWTPMHFAAYNGDTKAVAYLVDRGAKVNGAGKPVPAPLACALLRSDPRFSLLPVSLTANESINYMLGLSELTPFKPFRRIPDEEAQAEENIVTAMVKALLARKANPSVTGPDGFTPLHLAAGQGYLSAAKALTAAGAKVGTAAKNGETPLHLAARSGSREMVEYLLGRGADLKAKDSAGQLPLHEALRNPDSDILNLLIKRMGPTATPLLGDLLCLAAVDGNLAAAGVLRTWGASIYAKDAQGRTALHLAAYGGHAGVAELLLNGKANPNAADPVGQTPLHLAAAGGKLAAVELLVARGADVHARDLDGRTPLLVSVDPAVITCLAGHGADLDARDNAGASLLAQALANNNAAVLLALHDLKVDINVRTPAGSIPLLEKVNSDANLPVVQALLACGADVNAQNLNGKSALHLVTRGSTGIARLLLERTPNVNLRDNRGNTPLHFFVTLGSDALVQRLLELGPEVNACNHLGVAPLHLAVTTNSAPLVTLLLAAGADATARNGIGGTPLHNVAMQAAGANSFSSRPILDKLLAQGADPNARNGEGQTPLHLAAKSGNTEVIGWLLEQQVDVNAGDAAGNTPMKLAAAPDAIKLLQDAGGQEQAGEPYPATHPLAAAITTGDVEKVKRQITAEPALLQTADLKGNTPLHLAADAGKLDVVRALLALGARADAVNDRNETPLHQAVGSAEICTALLDNTARADIRDIDGRTPLDLAIAGRKVETALLLAASTAVNGRDYAGATPLARAAQYGLLDVAAKLLEGGADPNLAGHDGRTALDFAVSTGKKELADLLLARGAKVDPADAFGSLPIHKTLNAAILQALLDHGAGVAVCDGRGNTPLHLALGRNNLDVARLLLERGADPRAVDAQGRTALHLARTLDAVKLLLDRGMSIDARDRDGNTPLFNFTRPDDIKALIGLGVQVDARNTAGDTPLRRRLANGEADGALALLDAGAEVPADGLHLAATSGQAKVVEALLARGVKLDGRDAEGNTPLLAALAAGRLDMADALLDKGADVTLANKGGATALHLAAGLPRTADAAALKALLAKLFARKAVVGAKTAEGEIPLHYAARAGNAEAVSALLDQKSPVDVISTQGQTPLMCVITMSKYESAAAEEICRMLLAAGASPKLSTRLIGTPAQYALLFNRTTLVLLLLPGADVRARDKQGNTLLHDAVRRNDPELVTGLLEMGADPNARDADGNTPLLDLAQYGYLHGQEILAALRSKGAKLEARNNRGETPLLICAQSGPLPMLTELAESGADTTARTPDGRTLLHAAMLRPNAEKVRWLLDHGANPKAVDVADRTPLHLIAAAIPQQGTDDVIGLLIVRGADANARDENGRTPLMLAVQARAVTTAACLLEHGAQADIGDKDGKTALDYLTPDAPPELVQLLRAK